eukprot:CAMPEP_0119108810 /NCGR_PEP_ID=MMETSP1180-20130426/15670_1 /TAXON_ID=3052 ORGANISM="Chlamydomonas cf sp, Strain CCMP681" /NCGR_SAMPLE_ID=MMETSP1180 /ASSEMBLY_ACC=CAM_ASM_000741 /LENGTH=128 /DNA_ID=CAMNT_0007094467 /DNA_START=43 /DNA_END=429 /DNA_ORIENTATION=-
MALSAARPMFASIRPAAQRRMSLRPFATTSDMVKTTVSSSPVVIFSKTYCPYCSRVKSLFEELKVDCKILELDQIGDGDAIQSSLQALTGMRTVPQVFVGGQLVGGCDDTVAANQSGKLMPLVKAAQA